MNTRGRSLELFFIDGDPDGMITAEIFGWTGHVFLTPRIRLAEALRREHARYTGVYLLIGTSDSSNLPRIYIGESDDVGNRIRTHDSKLDWWTHAVFITSAANGLNKAHIKYIEARLIEQAKLAGRLSLENVSTPPLPSLSEATIANMESFVDQVLSVLPAIRIDGFIIRTRPSEKSTPKVALPVQYVEFELVRGTLKGNVEVSAKARLQNGEFIVQPGSQGRGRWVGVEHNYERLFDELIESGVYKQDGERAVFQEAYAFSSPSAAAAVLNGCATAGPLAWVLSSDKKIKYKQWEAQELLKQDS